MTDAQGTPGRQAPPPGQIEASPAPAEGPAQRVDKSPIGWAHSRRSAPGVHCGGGQVRSGQWGVSAVTAGGTVLRLSRDLANELPLAITPRARGARWTVGKTAHGWPKA